MNSKKALRTGKKIRKLSGSVSDKRKLVAFLYVLMRDDITPGRIETIMINHICGGRQDYSNGWLAKYAQNIAERLYENKEIND